MKKIVMIIDSDNENRELFKISDLKIEFAKSLNEAYKKIKIMFIESIVICNMAERKCLKTFINDVLKIDHNIKLIMSEKKIKANLLLEYSKIGVACLMNYPINERILAKKIENLEQENFYDPYFDDKIIGTGKEIMKVKNLIKISGDSRLLLLGETGVGKTSIVKWANKMLSFKMRTVRPFEHINCAHIKRDRLVDELFGHVKGAYTGAYCDKKGLVELAEGGDLFLDEIGDLDLECQAELLTYLDNYEYKKLGDEKRKRAQVRIICATNKNIRQMVEEKKFRLDLYSRISQTIIKVPSLRQRNSDIEMLMKWFIRKFTGREKRYDRAILKVYRFYPWKEGNVRELERACEYMCFQARSSSEIHLCHIDKKYISDNIDKNYNYDISNVFRLGFNNFISDFEKEILPKVLKPSESIRSNAQRLKMDRSTLRRKILKYEIPLKHSSKLSEA